MKMTSIDDMNIVKDLVLVKTEPIVEEDKTKQPEIVENAIDDSLRRDKNNLKMFMEVGIRNKR